MGKRGLKQKILLFLLEKEEEQKRELGAVCPATPAILGSSFLTILTNIANIQPRFSAIELVLATYNKITTLRRALRQLHREGLIKRYKVKVKTTGRIRRVYVLTDEGRLQALRFKAASSGNLKESLQAQVKDALDEVRGTKQFVTADELLEIIRKRSPCGERVWSKRRLGQIMKEMGLALIRKMVNGKVTRVLSSDVYDMWVALAYLKRAHMIDVDYWFILAALWLTSCKQKFSNKEEMLKYWTKKRVGQTLKVMGLRSRRRSWEGERFRTYKISDVPTNLSEEVMKAVIEAPEIGALVETRYEFILAAQAMNRRPLKDSDARF